MTALLLSTVLSANAVTRYVKPDQSGTGDGLSWTNASGNLQATINACAAGDEVWVAAGTYKPTLDPFANATPTDPREKTFLIKDGVKIYGGFLGTETQLGQRVAYAYTTILSGDIDNNGILDNGNAFHVLIASAAASGGIGVTVDGFTITAGNGSGTLNLTVNGNSFLRNAAGGIYLFNGTNTISNNHIYGNSSNFYAGGIHIVGGNTTIHNNWIHDNAAQTSSTAMGGGMRCFNGTFTITNNFIYNNTATGVGGGMMVQPLSSSAATVSNNVVFGNTSGTYGGGMFASTGEVNISNNTFFNNTAATNGGGVSANNNTTRFYNNIFRDNKLGASSTVAGADYGYNLTATCSFDKNYLQLSGAGDYVVASRNNFTTTSDNRFSQNPQFTSTALPLGADGLPRTADDGLMFACASSALNYGMTGSNIPAVDILNANRNATSPAAGAYETASKISFALPATAENLTLTQSGTTSYGVCGSNLIATVTSSGTNPVTGSVTAKVWIAPTQPVQYVKRHYEITPATGAPTATGKVTLYFTNQEFKDFNATSPALLLPDNDDPGTITGRKANLKIEKRGGTGNATGDPESYTGTVETIDPLDDDIFWNATNNRWEVSFNVNGFSGFFVKTQAQALPVEFGTITSFIRNGILYVNFSTLKEGNNDHFIIEGSADGVSFKELGTIASQSGNSDTVLDYEFSLDLSSASFAGLMALGLLAFVSFNKGRKRLAILAIASLLLSSLSCKKVIDINPDEHSLYVRIAQVDKDGVKSYSKVVKVLVRQ